MRLPLLTAVPVLVALSLQGVASAQQRPIFTPVRPKPPVEKPTAEEPAKEPGEQEAPKTASKDPVEVQFARLSGWPSKPAKEAAFVLAGLGRGVETRLIAALRDKDWRVRAGAATALGEMGSLEGIPELRAAIRDPSNRAGLDVLMTVLVKLDPRIGTETLLPFLAHKSSRVRRNAARALPRRLSEGCLPQALEMLGSRRGPIRAQAVDLLSRIPSGRERDELFLALGDPDARVADAAARHLGSVGTDATRNRLLEAARTAPARRAAYALIALVRDEDGTRSELLPRQGGIQKRARAMLRSDDPFYRGVAGVVLANLSFRSEDEALRQLADRFLVPILLRCVAGGVFFPDYRSVQDLCFGKMELLTGQRFGRSARLWETWWTTHEDEFAARRELRRLVDADLARVTVTARSRPAAGTATLVALTGDSAALASGSRTAPFVLDAPALGRLQTLLNEADFFADRGELRPERFDDGVPYTEVVVQVGNQSFRRFHLGEVPEALQPLLAFTEEQRGILAWQRFAPTGDPTQRQAFLDRERLYFANADDAARRARLLDLGVRAYPELPRAGRTLAVSLVKSAPATWASTHREGLLMMLQAEERLSDEALVLIDLLAPARNEAVQKAVLDVVAGAPGRTADEVLTRFLAVQPFPQVSPLLTDRRARVRAAAARALPRVGNHDDVATLLISRLEDFDAGVREACLEGLSALDDERVVGLLESVIRGADEGLRLRAVGALGRVGGDQAVPRIMDIYRSGNRRSRYAAIRALREAGGKRAVIALASIVRETGSLEPRREALDSLVTLGGPEVESRLVDILGRSREGEIRAVVASSLAEVAGSRATPHLIPLLQDRDPLVERVAVLTLGRIGAREAGTPLLRALAAIEGDPPAERSFERLTFFRSAEPSPPKRFEECKQFLERSGALSRGEWFVLNAQRTGASLDPDVSWLDAPTRLEPSKLAPLLIVLERGNAALRGVAEGWLLAGTDLKLERLDDAATEGEVVRRVGLYRQVLEALR